jgi:hypothetical protein
MLSSLLFLWVCLKNNRVLLPIKIKCLKQEVFMNELDEAHYHFALSEIMDMVRLYGYSNVINDLDAMMNEEINRKLEMVSCEV